MRCSRHYRREHAVSLWKDKYVIGLTGNIAVGKSLVRQMAQHLGAYTIDADALAHQVMMPGAPAYLPVVEMFGKIVLDENGHINRAMLGQIVFAIPDALTKLEAITHPTINQAVMTLVTRATQRIIVIEAIKLLESANLSQAVDTVWVVDASPEAQLKRLMEKRRMSQDEARRRIAAQRPQIDKLQRANVIIRNDGDPNDTWRQVQTAWNDIQKALKLTTGEISAVPTVTATPAPAAPVPSVRPVVTPIAASATPATSPKPLIQQTPPPTPPARTPAPSTQPVLSSIKPTIPPGTGTLRPITPPVSVTVRRGKPSETSEIARFITRVSGKAVEAIDIMLAFGQKSYLLATDNGQTIVGVVGWQVENLITRVDEIYLDPAIPKESVIGALVSAIEDHSKDLQSEVSFIALPVGTSGDIVNAFLNGDYTPIKMDDIKYPAWREVARELINPETRPLMKQLRTDRVMKPI
jgi:dephospho-CoA kinase